MYRINRPSYVPVAARVPSPPVRVVGLAAPSRLDVRRIWRQIARHRHCGICTKFVQRESTWSDFKSLSSGAERVVRVGAGVWRELAVVPEVNAVGAALAVEQRPPVMIILKYLGCAKSILHPYTAAASYITGQRTVPTGCHA